MRRRFSVSRGITKTRLQLGRCVRGLAQERFGHGEKVVHEFFGAEVLLHAGGLFDGVKKIRAEIVAQALSRELGADARADDSAQPLAGVLVAVVMGPIFGLLPGGFWVSAEAFTLGIGALSALIAGLQTVLGLAGFVLGALFNMLLANPLAGTMAPKEFVAGGWGTFGQYLPNGATATLLRSVNYFPSAPVGQQVWTLLAWIAVGVCLLGVGMALGKRGAAEPSAE